MKPSEVAVRPSTGGARESPGEGEPGAGIHPHDSEEVPRPALLRQHIAMSVLHLSVLFSTPHWPSFSLFLCHESICTASFIHTTCYYSGIFFIYIYMSERYDNFGVYIFSNAQICKVVYFSSHRIVNNNNNVLIAMSRSGFLKQPCFSVNVKDQRNFTTQTSIHLGKDHCHFCSCF